MGYYAKNPYEQPEPPRCLSCDEFMEEIGFGISFRWECRNPACEECPPKYQVIECSTCGEEYQYGEFCKNCVDGAYHDLDISTSTYKELVELREKQARPTKRAGDVACTCGKSILGEIDADVPCPVEWHSPPRA